MSRDEEQRIKDINNSERDINKSKEFWSEELDGLEDEMDKRAFVEEANVKWAEEDAKYLAERDKLVSIFNEACKERQSAIAEKWRRIVKDFCEKKR